ncbi:hypothetical protein N9242_07210, partial [Vicingaceae bacterium]|nr:hypothetical protein [Vicingaceae bacterium]
KDKKLTNNLSSVKVQLYNLILKNLRQYNPTNRTVYELRMQMDIIDILFEKGLYSQCKKVLKKAQDTARKYEDYIIIDALSIYEYEIAVKESSYDDIQHYINVTFPEVKEIRKTNEMLAEYEYLLASIKLLVLKSNRSGLTIDKSKFEKLVQHDLLQAEVNSQPYRCQIDHHVIWGYYHHVMVEKKETYFHRKKVLDLIEKHPHEILEHPKEWIKNARLLLVTLGYHKMYEELYAEQARIESMIDKISETKKTQNLNAEIYNTIYIIKLDMDIDRGLFKQSSKYAKEVKTHFKTYENQIDLNSKMVMYFNFSYAYFGNQEYQKSLKWINELINNNYGNVRMDLQCMARIMNIVIHYELGNYELISSLVRSTNRFFIKVNRKFEVETSFLKFANKNLQEEYSMELYNSFNKQIESLKEIVITPFEKKTIENFDIISWLKTKTESKTMEEIMSTKIEEEKTNLGVM